MYDFLVEELPRALESLSIGLVSIQGSIYLLYTYTKQDTSRSSIFGHSMGGHGALSIYLLNPGKYRSGSAMAPICNPSNPDCQWGKKAFSGYLNGGQEEGKANDATELIKKAKGMDLHILADYVRYIHLWNSFDSPSTLTG